MVFRLSWPDVSLIAESSDFTFSARVHPGSRENRIEVSGDLVRIRVTVPPADGKANEAVIRLLADKLSVSKKSLTILSGAGSKNKIIRVADMNKMKFYELLLK